MEAEISDFEAVQEECPNCDGYPEYDIEEFEREKEYIEDKIKELEDENKELQKKIAELEKNEIDTNALESIS